MPPTVPSFRDFMKQEVRTPSLIDKLKNWVVGAKVSEAELKSLQAKLSEYERLYNALADDVNAKHDGLFRRNVPGMFIPAVQQMSKNVELTAKNAMIRHNLEFRSRFAQLEEKFWSLWDEIFKLKNKYGLKAPVSQRD